MRYIYEKDGRKYMIEPDGGELDVTDWTKLDFELNAIGYERSTGMHMAVYDLKPGIYTKSIRGTVNFVTDACNDFYRSMAREYPNFQLINTNTVTLPDSVCMYITYRV